MVEHDLAKVGVASSSLVSRSKIQKKATQMSGFFLPEVYVLRREPSLVYRALSNIEPKICYRRIFLERQETLHTCVLLNIPPRRRYGRA